MILLSGRIRVKRRFDTEGLKYKKETDIFNLSELRIMLKSKECLIVQSCLSIY